MSFSIPFIPTAFAVARYNPRQQWPRSSNAGRRPISMILAARFRPAITPGSTCLAAPYRWLGHLVCPCSRARGRTTATLLVRAVAGTPARPRRLSSHPVTGAAISGFAASAGNSIITKKLEG